MAGDDEKIERLASPGEAAAEENQDTLVTHPNLEGNSNDGKKPADVAAEEKTLFEDKNFAEEGNQTSEKTQISEETQDGKKRQVTAATDYILEAKPSDDDKQVAKVSIRLTYTTLLCPRQYTAVGSRVVAVEIILFQLRISQCTNRERGTGCYRHSSISSSSNGLIAPKCHRTGRARGGCRGSS